MNERRNGKQGKKSLTCDLFDERFQTSRRDGRFKVTRVIIAVSFVGHEPGIRSVDGIVVLAFYNCRK